MTTTQSVSPITETEFVDRYDPRAFPPFAVTVDVALSTLREDRLCVLLVKRGQAPFHGMWALPGGFVGPDEPLAAAARKLAEKTGVARFESHLEQLASYGDPERDPRMRVVSVAYVAIAPNLPDPRPGPDALNATYWPIVGDQLATGEHDDEPPALAFDHARILHNALERVRGKLEYTSLATAFCQSPFTIADLRRVYEAVWNRNLKANAGNFQRKVLATNGFIEELPTKGAVPGEAADRARSSTEPGQPRRFTPR